MLSSPLKTLFLLSLLYCRAHLGTAQPPVLPDLDRQLFESVTDPISTVRTEALLKQGAHVNARMDEYGTTPLMKAAAFENANQVAVLLNDGADINAADKYGETALTSAMITPTLTADPDSVNETIHVLVNHGVRIDSLGMHGYTALMKAAEADELLPSLKLLLAKGAPLEVRDDSGSTALAHSADAGQTGPMRTLLAHGARVNTQDNKGTTPLMLAAETGDLEHLKLLLSHSADPKLKDNSGKTAVDYTRTNHDLSPSAKAKVLVLLRGPVRTDAKR